MKIAILITKGLKPGCAANISAILMGQAVLLYPSMYDDKPVSDTDGQKHAAIRFSTIVLEAGEGQLLKLSLQVKKEHQAVICVAFSKIGQNLHNAFEIYRDQISSCSTENTQLVGLILLGQDNEIRDLTKKFSLLK